MAKQALSCLVQASTERRLGTRGSEVFNCFVPAYEEMPQFGSRDSCGKIDSVRPFPWPRAGYQGSRWMKTNFVRSQEEIAAFRPYFCEPRFVSEALTVEFNTDREFVAQVLPPCLKAASEPIAYVQLSRWQTRGVGDFNAGLVYVLASRDGLEGVFPIASFFDEDNNTSWNREVWGEPGKIAKTRVFADGDTRWGYCERHGVRLIEITAELGGEEGPREEDSQYFELKMILSGYGGGLEYDPLLWRLDETDSYSSYRVGTASIDLRSGLFDPLGEVPIESIGEATWTEGSVQYSIAESIPQSNREDFLPWAYGSRYWDDPRLLSAPPRYREG